MPKAHGGKSNPWCGYGTDKRAVAEPKAIKHPRPQHYHGKLDILRAPCLDVPQSPHQCEHLEGDVLIERKIMLYRAIC